LRPSKYRSAQIYCTQQKRRQSERNSFTQQIHHRCSSRITHTMIQHCVRHSSRSTALLPAVLLYLSLTHIFRRLIQVLLLSYIYAFLMNTTFRRNICQELIAMHSCKQVIYST
ncbi:hypothetical protein T10_2584, partial [Trichinella papuae]